MRTSIILMGGVNGIVPAKICGICITFRKNDVMLIFMTADLRHLGFYGSNNGFFEKLMYDCL